MCDERPTSFFLTTDDYEDGLGERVVLNCPVAHCQYHREWHEIVTMLEVHEAIIEHQAEGIW